MRATLTAFILLSSLVAASAQQTPDVTSRMGAEAGDSVHSNGRTEKPEDNRQQTQGPTGPLNTQSGGAPAESPQGQTPPGMQAAPEGSSKTIVDKKS